MGINVRVETEHGDLISQVLDERGLTAALLPQDSASGDVCLPFVDPYGDTVFNQLQVPVLADELERKLGDLPDSPAREHGQRILRLIESARDKVHTYVRFVGD